MNAPTTTKIEAPEDELEQDSVETDEEGEDSDEEEESTPDELGEGELAVQEDVSSVRDHTMKDHKSQYPGKMAVADVRGTYSGCRTVEFSAQGDDDISVQINEYFKKNQGTLIVDIKYAAAVMSPSTNDAPHIEPLDNLVTTALITYTAQVSDEYLADLTEVQQEVDRLMTERKASRLQEKLDAEEDLEKQAKEQVRLSKVGKQCEENHGAMKKRMDAMEKEMKELKKKKGK